MSNFGLGRYVLSSCAAAALLAGCGGPQTPLGPLGPSAPGLFDYRTRQFVAPALRPGPETIGAPTYKMSGSLLYVANFVGNTRDQFGNVAIYKARARNQKNPRPIAIITRGIDEPGGDCIDAAGTLYVTNQSGNVAEYAPGKTRPFQYITKERGTPAACAIDSAGNLWVATLSDVIEYLKGSKKPHEFIEDGVMDANSVAFDHQGNMYVANLEPYYDSNVQVYPPGRKYPSRKITDGIVWPVATAVDSKGILYVANLLNAKSGCGNIVEYRSGRNRPFRTITDEISGPSGLAFDATDRLYEANGGINQCDSFVNLVLEFPYGSITPAKRTIEISRSPNGIAYYPPQLP